MNKQGRGLGKGLDALLKTEIEPAIDDKKEKISELPLNDIVANQFQPRSEFDDEALEELMQSIKQYGVLQPVLVRKTLNGYELIAGERRVRASRLAGLTTIPAIIREYNDSEITEIALIENVQREDLNPIEEAAAYDRLLVNFGLTQEQLAKRVGRSRSHIANFLRMLSLPKIIQEYVSRETISMGQAKPLISIDDEAIQLEAAEYIIEEDLSARECENLVKKLLLDGDYLKKHKAALEEKAEQENEILEKKQNKELFLVEAEDRLKMLLGTQVKIKQGRKKSKIEIEFYSSDDLDRIIEAFAEKEAAITKTDIKVLKV